MHWNNWDSAAVNQLPKPGRGSKPRVRPEFNWRGGGHNWPEWSPATWFDERSAIYDPSQSNSTEEEKEPTIEQQPPELTEDPQFTICNSKSTIQSNRAHSNWSKWMSVTDQHDDRHWHSKLLVCIKVYKYMLYIFHLFSQFQTRCEGCVPACPFQASFVQNHLFWLLTWHQHFENKYVPFLLIWLTSTYFVIMSYVVASRWCLFDVEKQGLKQFKAQWRSWFWDCICSMIQLGEDFNGIFDDGNFSTLSRF